MAARLDALRTASSRIKLMSTKAEKLIRHKPLRRGAQGGKPPIDLAMPSIARPAR